MTIHPFIKPEQAPEQSAPTDPWRGFSEQFWDNEPEHARPTSTMALIIAAAFGLLCLWGLVGLARGLFG